MASGMPPASSSRASSVERSGYSTPIGQSSSSTPTLSVPNAAIGQTEGDSSKLRTLLSILKKFIGVADIANVRFSLPAQLLEPVPNLEYWTYIDRPEMLVSVGDSDEPLGRMLGALRFWFTKDLKFIKGKPIKPYNSTLGEFFRCNWDVQTSQPPLLGNIPPGTSQPSASHPVRMSYFTEQTSHHPPVSAWWFECAEKGISGYGFDQISANFTGTRVRIAPGEHNKGIFLTLHKHNNEEYNFTHPTAHLGGLLKGSLSITVADVCYITCPQSGLKVIMEYVEEGWLGKAKNLMKGVILRYDPNNDNRLKIKDVKDDEVVGRVEGSWHEQIHFTLGSKSFDKSEKHLLIDLTDLWPSPKIIPPVDSQLPNESRMLWAPVTDAILAKQYTQATDNKTEIEERQRKKTAERKERNEEWQPRFFTAATTPSGRPQLTEDGKVALQRLLAGDYRLEPNKVYAC